MRQMKNIYKNYLIYFKSLLHVGKQSKNSYFD